MHGTEGQTALVFEEIGCFGSNDRKFAIHPILFDQNAKNAAWKRRGKQTCRPLFVVATHKRQNQQNYPEDFEVRYL